MIVAGIMSGTSGDGIDVALARISARGDECPRLRLLAHEAFPFSAALRKAVLAAMSPAERISVRGLRNNQRAVRTRGRRIT